MSELAGFGCFSVISAQSWPQNGSGCSAWGWCSSSRAQGSYQHSCYRNSRFLCFKIITGASWIWFTKVKIIKETIASSFFPRCDHLPFEIYLCFSRKLVINLLIGKGPNTSLKKAEIYEAAKMLKREISNNEYTKVFILLLWLNCFRFSLWNLSFCFSVVLLGAAGNEWTLWIQGCFLVFEEKQLMSKMGSCPDFDPHFSPSVYR